MQEFFNTVKETLNGFLPDVTLDLKLAVFGAILVGVAFFIAWAISSGSKLIQLRKRILSAIKQLNQPHARRGALRFIKTIPEQKSIRVHHKHMLKDFMTTLRKQDLPEIALMFATKNVELAPDDDHAHFNLARIFCILERYQDAIAHLHRALDLPNETEDQQIYRKMLHYVENQQRHRQVPFRITKQ